jgi:hypothetical protein
MLGYAIPNKAINPISIRYLQAEAGDKWSKMALQGFPTWLVELKL